MLFNSPTFLLLFLPIALIGFHWASSRAGRSAALAWLILCSLVFYAAWRPDQVWVPLLSLAVNWTFARLIVLQRRTDRRAARWIMYAGVCFNVCFLAIFKTIDAGFFGGGHSKGAFSTAEDLLIPLGLSFIAFQQIAFLKDVLEERIDARPLDHAFFLLFFPQLIMGPIVHYREIVPQTLRADFCGIKWHNATIGLAILAVGLFKKVGIADPVSFYVEAMFGAAAQGEKVGLVDAWAGAFAFQVQLYFDFSGYADMAIGLARLFNLNVPINFDSPMRSTDRFELWRRWHISFAMFMRRHVFWPLLRNKVMPLPGPLALALTALVSGLWHGLGVTFVLWGAVQAVIMLVSHYRRLLGRRWNWGRPGSGPRWVRIMLCLSVTMCLGVLFRAQSLANAGDIYLGMLGWHGIGFPVPLAELLGMPGLADAIAGATHLSGRMILYLIAAGAIIFALPPTHVLFGRYWTALDQRGDRAEPAPGALPALERRIRFELSPAWAVFIAALLVVSALSFGQPQRFVYFQF